jgi:short chain dehydrogenase
MTRLSGKTAVITGGATGIGRAAAKRFIEEGAFVFIFGRRQEALDAAAADLGANARAVQGSVSDLEKPKVRASHRAHAYTLSSKARRASDTGQFYISQSRSVHTRSASPMLALLSAPRLGGSASWQGPSDRAGSTPPDCRALTGALGSGIGPPPWRATTQGGPRR